MVACFLASCCVALRELLPPESGKSINLGKKPPVPDVAKKKKKKKREGGRDFKRARLHSNYKGPNSIKPLLRENLSQMNKAVKMLPAPL